MSLFGEPKIVSLLLSNNVDTSRKQQLFLKHPDNDVLRSQIGEPIFEVGLMIVFSVDDSFLTTRDHFDLAAVLPIIVTAKPISLAWGASIEQFCNVSDLATQAIVSNDSNSLRMKLGGIQSLGQMSVSSVYLHLPSGGDQPNFAPIVIVLLVEVVVAEPLCLVRSLSVNQELVFVQDDFRVLHA
ncbi:unnamed protein product [Acanthoscelides obtectus]|uniref:Uncharacterized protein n=1 Tax=Acanthoscelides obtectus TaxID=200917 RepID=A0A9P0L383_ACAOB|nr:unnamed protein product [Acanthoscelides obtectus]CAK1676615.1 hypothetical protein AOBTE_LOCUS30857 [Acanthoscelides obtectus]